MTAIRLRDWRLQPHYAMASSRAQARRLLCTLTSVNEDIGSSDEACPLRAQIHGKRADVGRLSPATHGNPRDELLIAFGVLKNDGVHIGSEWSGADAHNGNAFGSKLERKCARETEESGFAGGVCAALR